MEPIQPKSHRAFIWTVTGISVLFVLTLVFIQQFDFSSKIKSFETATNNFFVQTIHSDSLTPPPLRGVFGQLHEPLTDVGVLALTNKNRDEAGVKDLTLNDTLSVIAKQKLDDLFSKQYFEHVSPTGIGPSDLAKENGYDYIVIGENLALGSFNGDQALIDAWMASPGHRANILNPRYREIGIAVGQGVFEGKTTWIAVQEFGLPITACPQPSVTDKVTINKIKTQVNNLESSLATQKTAIDSATIKFGVDYNAQVGQYNSAVKQFNTLVNNLKAKISSYNKQVATFNTCAEATSTIPEQI